MWRAGGRWVAVEVLLLPRGLSFGFLTASVGCDWEENKNEVAFVECVRGRFSTKAESDARPDWFLLSRS